MSELSNRPRHPSDRGASEPSAPHPASALIAWLESHVRGRRVAVLGDATAGLAEAIAARGARLVHAYDPDPARAAEAAAAAGRNITPRPVFAPLEAELGVRDGAFDVVITPDLGLFADAAEALRRVRKLLSPSGIAVVCARNPDASRWLVRAGAPAQSSPTYYDLFDLVSLQFSEVKMLGQTPFVGYAIVDFSADEPEVTVDASLLDEPEAPEWYVAVAGDHRVEIDSYALVELPFAEVASALTGGEPTTLRRHELLEGRQAVEGRQLLEQRVRELEGEGGRLREALESATGATRDREAIATRLAEVERELGTAIARMREAEARAADTHVRAERLSTELREMDDELRRQRERASRLGKLLDEEKRARARVPVPPPQQVVIAAPPASDAAVTIRPEGTQHPDDARRAAAREVTLRQELDRAQRRIVELERRDEAPPATLEPVTVDPATVDRERVRSRLGEAEQQIKRLEAKLAEREAHATLAERRLVAALEQRESIEARLAAAEPELAALRLEVQKAGVERQKSVAERDRVAAERDKATLERDRVAAERDKATSERDRATSERDRATSERDRATSERDKAASERDRATSDRDKVASDREKAGQEREKQLEVRRAAAQASAQSAQTSAQAALAAAQASLTTAQNEARVARERAAERIAALEVELSVLRHRADEAERRARESAEAGPLARAHEEEIDRLESMLRDRGREVARLQSELREGLRIGKELVQELESARVFPVRGGPVGGGTRGDGAADRDGRAGRTGANGAIAHAASVEDAAVTASEAAAGEAAAERAARAHADVVGAALKIAQLEHEVRRLRTTRTPDEARRELETAFALAQEEIAALREGRGAVVSAGGAVEQQVLLAQLDAMRADARGGEPRSERTPVSAPGA